MQDVYFGNSTLAWLKFFNWLSVSKSIVQCQVQFRSLVDLSEKVFRS